MWTDPRFSSAAATRWAQLRAGVWSDSIVQKMIADTATLVRVAGLQRRLPGRCKACGIAVLDCSDQHQTGCLPPCSGPGCLLSAASPIECTRPSKQIKPAVLRNFERYSAVLLKPWYSSAEQEWTTGKRWPWMTVRLDESNDEVFRANAWAGRSGQPGACGLHVVFSLLPCGSRLQRWQTCRAGCSSTWLGWMEPLHRQWARPRFRLSRLLGQWHHDHT